MSIDRVQNTGAAFSVLPQLHWFYLAVALVVSLYILFFGYRYGTTWYRQVLIGMILGGALSNGVDRLVQGYVVDFIDFHFWPVFNVADSCIVIAIVVLLVLSFLPSQRSAPHRDIVMSEAAAAVLAAASRRLARGARSTSRATPRGR